MGLWVPRLLTWGSPPWAGTAVLSLSPDKSRPDRFPAALEPGFSEPQRGTGRVQEDGRCGSVWLYLGLLLKISSLGVGRGVMLSWGGEGRVAGLPCWGPFLLKVSLPPSQRDLDPARSACPNFRSLSRGGVEVGVPFTYPPSRHSLQVALLRNCSRFCALGQTCRDPLRHWSPGPEVTLMTPCSMISWCQDPDS